MLRLYSASQGDRLASVLTHPLLEQFHKHLFHVQHPEELRAVEVGLLQPNRVPGQEVGSLKIVTALVEVGTNGLAVQ